jgi:hypothetical protein
MKVAALVLAVAAAAPQLAAQLQPQPLVAIPLTAEFGYQGLLRSGGALVNGTCDFQFGLYDQLGGGSLLTTQTWIAVPVTNGLFNVTLHLGAETTILGDSRYLEISVGCPTGSPRTLLTPRQKQSPTPYALTLRAGATMEAAHSGPMLTVSNTLAAQRAAVFENVGSNSAIVAVNDGDHAAIFARSSGGMGVDGRHLDATGASPGILGSTNSTDNTASGVKGEVAATNAGIASAGVYGLNDSTSTFGYGVLGYHAGAGAGVYGYSATGWGVKGSASVAGAAGVDAIGVNGANALLALSDTGNGVHAQSGGAGISRATVWAQNYDTGPEPSGIAVYGENASGDATLVVRNTSTGDVIRALSAAGTSFVFRVSNTGTVRADGSYNCGLASGCFNTGSGADVAERIDAHEALEPGDVIEIVPDAARRYRRCRSAASPLVAGVVSTAPAITLNNDDLANVTGERTDARPLVALVGVVPVKASAENGPIRAGDLLVSAATAGHAMRAGASPATGAVIGKALSALDAGTGRVELLVMLR